jgi:hypothetical protein
MRPRYTGTLSIWSLADALCVGLDQGESAKPSVTACIRSTHVRESRLRFRLMRPRNLHVARWRVVQRFPRFGAAVRAVRRWSRQCNEGLKLSARSARRSLSPRRYTAFCSIIAGGPSPPVVQRVVIGRAHVRPSEHSRVVVAVPS